MPPNLGAKAEGACQFSRQVQGQRLLALLPSIVGAGASCTHGGAEGGRASLCGGQLQERESRLWTELLDDLLAGELIIQFPWP